MAVREGVRIIKVPLYPSAVHAATEEYLNLKVVEYREQTIVGDDLTGKYESVTVWAPTTQGPHQTLELLLETYERHQTRRAT
jgi:hypothetical protein